MTVIVKHPKVCDSCGHLVIFGRCSNDSCETNKSKVGAMKRFRVTWTWTTWTFGIWWDKKKLHAWGFDLGPCELIYRKEHFKVKPNTRYQFLGTVNWDEVERPEKTLFKGRIH